MAGVARGVVDVASNAGHYGMANGGTGDKTALLAVMFRLEMTRMESGIPTTGMEPGILIKLCNQARWGTRQAVIVLLLDTPAFKAEFVDAFRCGVGCDFIDTVVKHHLVSNRRPLNNSAL